MPDQLDAPAGGSRASTDKQHQEENYCHSIMKGQVVYSYKTCCCNDGCDLEQGVAKGFLYMCSGHKINRNRQQKCQDPYDIHISSKFIIVPYPVELSFETKINYSKVRTRQKHENNGDILD